MSFTLLPRSRTIRALSTSRHGKPSNRSSANRKLHSTRLGFQPLEDRQLLSITPNGNEIFVNAALQSGDQDTPAIAVQETTGGTAALNSVVAFESFGVDVAGTDGVRFNRYNPSTGAAIAGAQNIQPHTMVQGNQNNVAVAMRNDGSFVVVWQTSGQTDVASTDADGIYFRRYNTAGVAQGTIETLVNQVTAGSQTNPSIAIDNTTGAPGGDFIITWESDTNVFARHFNSAGAALSTEFQVNDVATSAGDQLNPVVSVDGDGDFVIVWQSNFSGNEDVIARRFSSAAFPVGGAEISVANVTTGDQTAPAVSMDGAGNFIVAWQGPGATDLDVYARRYDAAGVALGAEFVVNSTLTGDQSRPGVALHDPVVAATSRGFVVTWQGPEDDPNTLGQAVFARGYTAPTVPDPQGAPRGNEIQVHAFPRSADQAAPAISMDSTSAPMIVYQSEPFSGGSDGSGYGVYARRFLRLNTAPILTGGPLNDGNLTINIAEDSAATFVDLTAIDPDGDPITFFANGTGTPATTIPQNGILQPNTAIGPPGGTVAAGDLLYTPNVDFVGADRFTYTATDGSMVSTIGYANITVNPVNDPPTLAKSGTIAGANNVNPVQILTGTSTAPEPHGLTAGHRVMVTGLMVTQLLNTAPVPQVGNPVQFTTPLAHALATGDQLNILGVVGTGVYATIVGNYTVTVVNATTFSLVGTAFTAGSSYTANSGRLERLSPANGTRTVQAVQNSTTFSLAGVTTAGGTAIANTGTWSIAPLSGLITAASNTTPITITSSGHGLVNNQIVSISDVTGNVEAIGTFRIGGVAANTFQLFDLSTGAPVGGANLYTGGGQWRIVQTGVITAAAGTPITITSNGHGLVNGDRVTVSNVLIGQAITAVSDVGANNTSVVTSNGHNLQTGQKVSIQGVRKGSNVSVATVETPIRIQTSTNHRLQTGAEVVITGVTNNPAANGTFTITRIDDNEFFLDGQTGTGTQGTNGTWSAASPANGERTVRVVNTNAFQLQDLKVVAGTQWNITSTASPIVVNSNGNDFEDDARGGQVTITGVEIGAVISAAASASGGAAIQFTSNGHNLGAVGSTVQLTLRGISGSGIFGTGALNNTFSATVTGTNTFTIPQPFSGTYTANSGEWVRTPGFPGSNANANGTFLVTGAANTFTLFGSTYNGPYITTNATWSGLTQVQLNEGGTGPGFVQPAGFPTPVWTTSSAANGTYDIQVTNANQFQLNGSAANGTFFLNTEPVSGQVIGRWDRTQVEVIPQNQPSFTINIPGISPGPANELNPFPTITITATSSNQTLLPDAGITVNYPLGGDVTLASLTLNPTAGQSGAVDITVTFSDDGTGTPANDRVETYTLIVNNPPTIDSIPNQPIIIQEDSINNPFTLTGITEGLGEAFQNVTLRAVTLNNTTLLPDQTLMLDPKISYAQGSTTAVLNLVPVGNANGLLRVRVFVKDDSGAGEASDTVFRDFQVQIIGIADSPVITDVITAPNTQSPPVVITQNGADTGFYRIQNIFGGTLVTSTNAPVTEGTWIAANVGTAGLRFTPFPGSITPGQFEALPSTFNNESGVTAGIAAAVGHIYIANAATTVNAAGNNYLATATAKDADGNTVVVYVGQNDPPNRTELSMRRFNAAGAQLGNPVILDFENNSNFNYDPAIAMDPDGDFVVVWTDPTPLAGGALSDIHARLFNAQGIGVTATFRVNTATANTQFDPAVSRDSQGNFVVTWTSTNQDTGGTFFADTADSTGIFAQRFDFNGLPVGREFRVNQAIAGDQRAPSVSMDPSGNFIIAWETINQGNLAPTDNETSGYSVHAQRFDAAGNRVALRELHTITYGGTIQATGFQYLLRLGNKSVTVTGLPANAANYAANVAAIQAAMNQLAPGSFVNGDPRSTGNGTTTFIVTLPAGGGIDHGGFGSPAGDPNDFPLMSSHVLGSGPTVAVALTGAPSQDGPTQNNTVYGGSQYPVTEVQRVTVTNAAEAAAMTLTAPGFAGVASTYSSNRDLTAQNMQRALQQSLIGSVAGEVTVREHIGPITNINIGVTPIEFDSGNHGLVNGDRIAISGVLVSGVNIGRANSQPGGSIRVNATGHATTPGQQVVLSGLLDTRAITGATNADPIVITSVIHGLVNGDTVMITGVLGNTAANGTWTVAGATADTFTLINPATGLAAVGNGAYTSGGAWSSSSKANGTWTVEAISATVGTITGNNTANPVQITSPNHGLVTGQLVQLSVTGPNSGTLNTGLKTVTVTGRNTFTLNGVNGAGFGQNTGTWTADTAANANVFQLAGTAGRGGPSVINTGRFDRMSTLNNSELIPFYTIQAVNGNTFTLLNGATPIDNLDGAWTARTGSYRLIQSSTGQSKVAFDVGFSGRYGMMGDIPNMGATVTGGTVAITTPRAGNAAEFLVNNNTGTNQRRPSVAMDRQGNFLVAWENDTDIHARLFNSAGVVTQTTPLSGNRNQFAVAATAGDQTAPKVLGTSDGKNFFIAWNDQPDIAQLPARLRARPITGYNISTAALNGRLGNAVELIPTDSSNPLPGTQPSPYSIASDDTGNISATIIVSAGGLSSVSTRTIPLDLPVTVSLPSSAAVAGWPFNITSTAHGLQTGDQITVVGYRVGAAISGLTGPGVLIQVTSAFPHNLTTGEVVRISGVQGNTQANGDKTITVTGPTTFTLDGSFGGPLPWVAGTGFWTRVPGQPGSVANVNGRFKVTVINANTFSFGPVVNNGPYLPGAYSIAFSDIVTDATNSTPIAITAPNHGLTAGSYVTITNVGGNTAANGRFQIAPVAGAVGNVTGPGTTPIVVTAIDHRLVTGQQIDISGVQVGKAITGMTGLGVSPIVVTSNAHLLNNGDTVVITDVDGNTNANGMWIVAGVTANTFQLVGSTGNAPYIANTGKWINPAAATNANGTFFVGPATGAIASVGATSPITITTNGHGLVNGELVTVSGVQVGAAINAASTATPIVITSAVNHNLSDQTQVTVSGVQVGAVITAMTGNGVPITVTSNGHNLQDGDNVTITGALGNTAANGTWIVTNRAANTFQLQGAPNGNGTYTASSGTWTTTSRTSNANGVRFVQALTATTFSLFTDAGLQNPVAGGTNGPYLTAGATWTRPTVPANPNGTFAVQAVNAAGTTFQLVGAAANGPYLTNTGAWVHGAAATITGASDPATPIVITSLAHGLAAGSRVVISGVNGNTAANGIRFVGNVTLDTFALYSDPALQVAVASNGVYVSGGTWAQQDLSQNSFALYSDAALTTPVAGNANYGPGTGQWAARELSTNVFALTGTTGIAGYTGGGRWTPAWEDNAPTVETVYAASDLSPPLEPTFRQDVQPILNGERLQLGVKKLVVTFSENMSTQGGPTGAHSVTNVANWQVLRNAAAGQAPSLDVSHLITDIAFGFDPVTNRYEATLNFSQGLPQGSYLLRATPAIWDTAENALDGDRNGLAGGNFELRFDSSGDLSADVNDTLVHEAFVFSEQTNAQVARDAAGNFVVVWQSDSQDTSGQGIFARRFLADGTPLGQPTGGNEVQTLNFSDPLNLPNNGSFFTIDIPGDTNPPAVVQYSTTATVTRDRIRAALTSFDVPITVVANSAVLYTITFGGLAINRPTITASANLPGTFPITIATTTEGAANSMFQVNTTIAGDQTNPAVAMGPNGNFVVVWESPDASSTGIFGRTYTVTGAAGAQFAVNTLTANPQSDPAVDMADDGTIAVVWRSDLADGNEGAIRLRKFNATGGAPTAEIAVNNITFGDQLNPDVAIGMDGVAMVVWETPDFKGGITNATNDGLPIVITSNGHGLTTGQTVVISGVAGNLAANGTWVVNVINANTFSIPPAGDGPYTAGTGQFEIPSAGKGVFQRRFNSAAAVIGTQARVNFLGSIPANFAAGDQTNPVVEADAFGRFVVAYNSPDADGVGIFAQAYHSDLNNVAGGLKVGTLNETQRLTFVPPPPVNNRQITLTLNGVTTPPITFSSTNENLTATRIREGLEAIGVAVAVAPTSTTVFDITFLNEGVDVLQMTATAVGGGFTLQVLTVQNGGIGGGYEFPLNVNTTGDQVNQRIAMDSDGDYVVAWESGTDIIARRFNILGAAQSPEFTVNATTTGDQTRPALAVDADGDLLIGWTSADASSTGVYVRRYGANLEPPALPVAEANGTYTVTEGDTVGISLSSLGSSTGAGFIYRWDLDNDGVFGEAATAFGSEQGPSPTFIPNGLDGTATAQVTVRLQVDDGIGGLSPIDTATIFITNVEPVNNGATLTDYQVDEGQSVNVVANAATDVAGDITNNSYEWDLDGDATPFNSAAVLGQTVPFSAAAIDGVIPPATRTVFMRVRDKDGALSVGTTQVTVTINNAAPVNNGTTLAIYQVDEGQSDEGQTVDLVANAATDFPGDLSNSSYEWDLDGDATPFNSAAVLGQTVPFDATGIDGPATRTVFMRVRDKDNALSAAVTTVTVQIDNMAPVDVDPQGAYTVDEGASINLTAADATDVPADVPGLIYEWDLDGNATPFDAVSATGQTVPFDAPFLSATEVRTIYLRVRDDDGGIGGPVSTTITINDLPPPTADAGGAYSVVAGQSVVLDRAFATPPGPYTYSWDLDNDGFFAETGIGALFGDEVGLSPTFDASGLTAPNTMPVTFRVNYGPGLDADASTTVNVIAAVTPQIIDNSDPPGPNGAFGTTNLWAAGGGAGVGRNNNVLVAFGESFQPTDTAIWTFNLAGPGRYRVASTWFTNPAFDHLFTDVARFEIADGAGAVLGTSIIDMKQFPNDFTDAGSAWENMGAFEVTGPTLRVTLFSSQDDATYVVADAIRIEKIADLSPVSEIQVTMNGENGVNIPDNTGVASFGTTDYGDAVTKTFTISNQGTAPLTIGPGLVTATPNTIFTVISQPALLLLNPGQSTTFQVQMDAGTMGPQSATISFANSEGNENPYDFMVSGTVLATNIIDNGDPEYAATPAASFGFFSGQGRTGVNGGSDYAYTRNIQPGVGPGNDAATWTFSVAPGQYRVSTTYVFNGGFDGSAPFTVFEGPAVVGGAVRGSRIIDQRVAPDDFAFNGSNWEDIGLINIVSDTTMTVQLLGDDPNFFVIADAILIERLGDIPAGPEIVVYVDDQEATAATVDYGSVQLNHPVDKTFHIANAGTTVLDITSAVTVPVGYELVSPPTLTSIDPGQVSDFVVRLKAEYEGADPPLTPDPITFDTNDTDETTVSITATGTVLNYRIIDDQNFADGYSVTAGVGTGPDPGAFGLDVSFAHGPTAAPPVVATYTFNNLTPGNYLVLATWPDRGGSGIYSGNTSITVMDGAVVEETFVVDQRDEPTFNFAGDVWNVLTAGFLSITDTVTVTITSAGADGFVLFDAILLARGGPPAPPGNSESGEVAGTSSLLVAPSSGGGLRTEQEESDALDQALLGTTYWDDELEKVASVLAADPAREVSYDDVAPGRIDELEADALELALTDWLEQRIIP